MLNMLGHITGLTAILVDVVAIVSIVPLTLGQRLIAAGAAGAWVGLASALGAAGALAYSPDQPVPIVGLLFARRCLPRRRCGSLRQASAPRCWRSRRNC